MSLDSRDELMLQGLVGFQSAFWVPSQASSDEIQESIIVAFQRLLKSLGTRPSSSSFGADSDSWLSHGIKEELLARALFDQVLLWRTKDLHDTGKLLLFVLSGKDRVACEKFCENTTKGPHIDRNAVAHAQDDLWRSVKSRLNVGIHLLILETTGTEIDDFNLGVHWMCKKNVFGLEITMDDALAFQHDQ